LFLSVRDLSYLLDFLWIGSLLFLSVRDLSYLLDFLSVLEPESLFSFFNLFLSLFFFSSSFLS
jgi:hypothetical protein